MHPFLERHADDVLGILNGFDRVRLRGTLRWLAHTRGMQSFLNAVGVPLTDFGSYVEDVTTRRLELVGGWRKCLHYYHYLIHPTFGFAHLRLQSWFPFTVHVGLNGREWLACQMDAAHLAYRRRENCFVWIADLAAAQQLADRQLTTRWDAVLTASAAPGACGDLRGEPGALLLVDGAE